MSRIEIPCGAKLVPVSRDDRIRLVRQSAALAIEPAPDLERAVTRALEHPLDRPPLTEQVKPGARVTIAFDDPTVLCYAPVWEVALRKVIDQLTAAGVNEQQITLLCANALHRKFTHEELARTIGSGLVRRFGERLLCHDAEDQDNLIHLGCTRSGHDVELNRLAVETDLCIYLNTSCWRGFNGGWKSICVGLSSYRSIRHSHTPDIMSMSTSKNRMHEILEEMGALVNRKLGVEHIFKIETVMANPMQMGQIWSGSIAATRRQALRLQEKHTRARRDLLEERADIICYGVPAWSPYATFSQMNPLLTLSSTGLGYLGGVIEALGKPGCSVIMATPCPDEWNRTHHPSYPEVWERVLTQTRDPQEIRQRFERSFATRKDYVELYRHRHAFHPVHGIMATYPLKRLRHAGRIFVAHAEKPELVEHLGFTPAPTVDDAIARARAIHGADATVALVQYPMAMNR